jgi:hypothetical protein
MKSERLPGCVTQQYDPFYNCTGALATGTTSAKGNMVGQTSDLALPYWQSIKIELVTPEKGYRYLRFNNPKMGSMAPLNEKGVGVTWYYRGAHAMPYKGPGKRRCITEDELLSQADSAKKYMELWSENVTRYGTGLPNGAGARLIADAKEGYLLEAANWVFGNPANHAITGPMTDQVFAHANFFVSKALKQVELGTGPGHERAKKMWELLVAQQYDSIAGRNSGISLTYLMNCFRHHGDVSPEDGRLTMGGVPTGISDSSNICSHGLSIYSAHAHICAVVPECTDLLSCLWLTFGQPCISPFLPVYIGINEVPEAIKTNNAAELFERLRLEIEYHPEYREEISHFWKIFEIQTVEESLVLQTDVAGLAASEKQNEARKRLTDFVDKKCTKALSEASQILKDIQGLPRFRKAAKETYHDVAKNSNAGKRG